jgi:hypothetical protein
MSAMKNTCSNFPNNFGFSLAFLLFILAHQAQAGPLDKLKKLMGNDTDNITIFYVIGGMFIFCILIYFVGNYFMKKNEAKQPVKTPHKITARPAHLRRNNRAVKKSA